MTVALFGRRRLLFECPACALEHEQIVRVIVDVPGDGSCEFVARCPVCAFDGKLAPMVLMAHALADYDAPIHLADLGAKRP